MIFLIRVTLQRLPKGIGTLKKLRVLEVEENQLETLPNEIGTYVADIRIEIKGFLM